MLMHMYVPWKRKLQKKNVNNSRKMNMQFERYESPKYSHMPLDQPGDFV